MKKYFPSSELIINSEDGKYFFMLLKGFSFIIGFVSINRNAGT